MIDMTQALDQSIRAVCPIHGIAQLETGWRIDFTDEASEAQRQAAVAVVAQFNPLDVVKTALIDEVQRAHDEACARIITPGAIMASVYRAQIDAANTLLASLRIARQTGTEPEITTLPPLASLVGVAGLGATEEAVALSIKARNEICEVHISELNRRRLLAKAAVAAASTESEARAAAVVDWRL